jgi:hypothetical protein
MLNGLVSIVVLPAEINVIGFLKLALYLVF